MSMPPLGVIDPLFWNRPLGERMADFTVLCCGRSTWSRGPDAGSTSSQDPEPRVQRDQNGARKLACHPVDKPFHISRGRCLWR